MKHVTGTWIHSDFAQNALISLVSLDFLRVIAPFGGNIASKEGDETGLGQIKQPIIIRIGLSEGKMAIIEGVNNIISAESAGYTHLPVTFQLSNHLPYDLLPFSYSLSIYTKDPDLADLWVSHGKIIKYGGYQDVKYVNPELVLLSEYLENHFFE